MSYDIAQLSKDLGLGDIAEQLKGQIGRAHV